MTVAEMITELEKLPRDARVVIEGYEKGVDDPQGGPLNPEAVEGAKNEVYGVRAVIWASIVTEPEDVN
jgi:hypothetical protein